MATPTVKLINALRVVARKMKKDTKYQWGHMGLCNCGNLAQELTMLTAAEIHQHALQTREGDWSEQTEAYCPTSKLPMDLMVTKMLEAGLTIADLQHLEKLSDKEVLKQLPSRHLSHNVRHDVVLYMETWANLLEDKLLENINFDDLNQLKEQLVVVA
jgi:hypothetical protein